MFGKLAVGQGVDESQHAAVNAGQHVGSSYGADDELNWREVAGRGKDSQNDQTVAEHRDQNDDPDSQADDPALKQVITRLEGTWKKTKPKVIPRIYCSVLEVLLGVAASPSPLLTPPALCLLNAEDWKGACNIVCSLLQQAGSCAASWLCPSSPVIPSPYWNASGMPTGASLWVLSRTENRCRERLYAKYEKLENYRSS